MKTIWFNHLHDSQDRESFKADVVNARKVLTRLQHMLEKDLQAIDEEMESDEFFKAHNLTERMVIGLARKSELRKIIKLLEV